MCKQNFAMQERKIFQTKTEITETGKAVSYTSSNEKSV